MWECKNRVEQDRTRNLLLELPITKEKGQLHKRQSRHPEKEAPDL